MIEYTLLNVLILKLKICCCRDKFDERSKFGQYDEVKNHAPLKDNRFIDEILKTDAFLYFAFFSLFKWICTFFLPLSNWLENLLCRMKYSCNKFRQMYKTISIRDWILLGGMKDRGSKCKFRNERSAFRNLHMNQLSFIILWERNK